MRGREEDAAPLLVAYADARRAALGLRGLGSPYATWGYEPKTGTFSPAGEWWPGTMSAQLAWWPADLVAAWGPIGVAIAEDAAVRRQLVEAANRYLIGALGSPVHAGWDFVLQGAHEPLARSELAEAVGQIGEGLGMVSRAMAAIAAAADRPGASAAHREATAELGRAAYAALYAALHAEMEAAKPELRDAPAFYSPRPTRGAQDVVRFLHRWQVRLFGATGANGWLRDQAAAIPPAGDGRPRPWAAEPRDLLIASLAALAGAVGAKVQVGRDDRDATLTAFHSLVAAVWGHLAGLVELSAAEMVRGLPSEAGAAEIEARAANAAEERVQLGGLDRPPGHRVVREALRQRLA